MILDVVDRVGTMPILCYHHIVIQHARLACAFMSVVLAKFVRIAVALVVSTLFLCSRTATGQQPPSGKSPTNLHELSEWFELLAERVSPAVVQIVSSGLAPVSGAPTATVLSRRRSGGSGVIVDPNGYIVTNAHGVAGARRVQVLLASRI